MGIKNGIRMVPVLFAVALAGCGSDSSGPGIGGACGLAGSSSGTVGGAVTANLNGCAVYIVSTSSNVTTIGLTGGTAATPTHVLAMSRNGGRPVAGSYTIGAGATQYSGIFSYDGGTSADRSFLLTSGTVTITGSSSGTLTGTLTSVVATEATVAAATISIAGSFTAKCTTTGSSTC